MADQELGIKIKTTSDVPEAMGKAKAATESLDKHVQAINKRFGDAFKDIFLQLAGPTAIFALFTRTVSDYFEKIKQSQAEANKAAIDGVNERMAAEDVYYARKVARENEEKNKQQQAFAQPQTTAFEFLMRDPRAKSIFGFDSSIKTPAFGISGKTMSEQIADMKSRDPNIQDAIRRIIAEDMAKSGAIQKPGQVTQFKGPEGFSNVIGVGANPVLEAQAAQLEESQKQTALLQNLVDRNPFMPADFTKNSQSK